MKVFKLWVDIEEHDVTMGEYRSLSEAGEAAPVPIAVFSDLVSAVRFAEALGLDAAVDDGTSRAGSN